MKMSVAIGQYISGDSQIHKMDPRFKLTASIIFIVAVFLAKNIFSFILLAGSIILAMLMTKIPVMKILRGMRPILIIMLFTAVINIFWYKGETLLVSFWIVRIYLEGIFNALLIVFRIVILLAGSSVLLTYTTTPLSLTDGIESLLSPLKKIKVPVHYFSMMMTIALRFIPTLMDESTKIMNAQKSRGADFSSGGLISRAKALVPVIVPLFVSSFRRAGELADAMECRCYAGGEGQTKMNVLCSAPRDYICVLLVIMLCAAVIFINRFAPGYSLSI